LVAEAAAAAGAARSAALIARSPSVLSLMPPPTTRPTWFCRNHRGIRDNSSNKNSGRVEACRLLPPRPSPAPPFAAGALPLPAALVI
jgi:hypothetical protein